MTIRFQVLAVFLRIAVVVALPAASFGTEEAPSSSKSPADTDLVAGRFQWAISEPVFEPLQRPGDQCFSVKDPSVVQYDGRWHLFCTIRGKNRSHQIEYFTFTDWKKTHEAKRVVLKFHDGFFCAPQVFYFRPHKKWYLICQASDESWRPKYGAAYATTTDIADPTSWSRLQPLQHRKADGKSGLDFWVSCDDKKAHLFFTTLDGRMWREETSLADFPTGWSEPVLALKGDIFEASHTYKLAGMDKYLTVIEAQGGHGWRYFKAYTANRLDGKWTPIAATKDRAFASMLNTRPLGARWTDCISHGELLRAGYDERLEVAPARLRFVFQGVTNPARSGKPYGQIPWKLGLLEPVRAREPIVKTSSEPASKPSSKPNVIIIMTDDQGYQDLGCFGSPKIKTPHIDRMAKEGMRFTDFYSGASVCTPSRAALMTGCYASRVGNLPVLFPRSKRGLNPEEITIAELLKSQGYATACIGKWHLGHQQEFLPTRQGFDSYYGVPYSNDMTLDPTQPLANDVVLREGVTLESIKSHRKKNLVPLMRDEKIIEYPVDQNTLTKRYTEEAVRFIKANKERPFFIYLPHTMPHIPLYVAPEFEGKSAIGLYGDSIEEIDWSTGKILDTLRELQLDARTLVVFTSDNGPWKLAQNSWVKGNKNRRVGGFAHPLRGYKFSRFEGGMRVPTVMWWPGRIPAGRTCSEVAASMDLLPTCAELAGARVPDDRVIDGQSIVALLEGRPGAKSPHEAFFYRTQAVRAGDWKLKGKELYNLKADISESKNVAAEHPEVVARLRKLLGEFKADLKANGRPAGGPAPKPKKKKKKRNRARE